MPLIHATAIVDKSAIIADDVKIGAFCIVEADTRIGAGCVLDSGAQVLRFTTLGERNQVGKYAILGGEPMDQKYLGEDSWLEIGSDNIVREFSTIHRGTAVGGGLTRIANHNLIMSYVHITHDCLLGSHNIIVNAVQMAGHVVIEDHVRIGVTVGIHQYCRIGAHSIVGMMSKVARDVLPFTLVDGHPAQHYTINKVGLTRDGFSSQDQKIIMQAFKALRNKDTTAVAELESEPLAKRFFDFARAESKRGLSSFT
jgi:UDP-N-acetylglucosamine acyltransferase